MATAMSCSSSSPVFLLTSNSITSRNSISFSSLASLLNGNNNTRPRGGARRREQIVAASNSSNEGEAEQTDKQPFKPFGFVTDNPSSRSAIQLPESPAEDGNVGQMLYRIEDKGKEYGSYVKSGKLRWFVRETGLTNFGSSGQFDSRFINSEEPSDPPEPGSSGAQRGTIVFLHGAPTQSYSYRAVMFQMANAGYHCFAPDWIGFGFSDKPQPGYGFSYTEEEFHKSFDELLDALNITAPFFLVVQGFLVGSYGLTWALKNSSKVLKLAILNSPLAPFSRLPGLFQQLRIPLFGEFTCQNAVIAERFIQAGSPYVLKLDKADVYRLPYLSSGGPGFALLEAARKANFQDVLSRISVGFLSTSWEKPILLAWGISDKYLSLSEAEEFQKGNSAVIKLEPIEGAGHMPQEDWPEKVVTALRAFL